MGTCFARRIPGGVARLRRRLPNALPIRAASLSGLYSDRFFRNAVHLCGMGGQAHRVTLCSARRAHWRRRGADLHLYIVGSATAAAVQNFPRIQGRRWNGWRHNRSAPETSIGIHSVVLCKKPHARGRSVMIRVVGVKKSVGPDAGRRRAGSQGACRCASTSSGAR